jgi:hypothetical protein
VKKYTEENPRHDLLVEERTKTIDKRQLDRSLVKKRREFSF